jgi:hypothetical protein
MNPKKSNSNEPANPTTYRITDSDKKLIIDEHGSLSSFLNECVAKEIKRIQKKKGVKAKITKS